jgi:DNA-binding Lrp family transcriptional regulator
MMREAGTLESLRQLNRSRVLTVLQQRGRASRAEIVRATGLSRTTVSSLVANLLAEGVVVEGVKSVGAAPSSTGGRPPIFLELDPASAAFVGLDFAHHHVQGAVADRSGRLLADDREVLEVDHHPDHALGAATRIVTAALGRAGVAAARVLGVGAAVSAPLRSHQHRFASDRIFPGWAEVDLPAALGSGCRFGSATMPTWER